MPEKKTSSRNTTIEQRIDAGLCRNCGKCSPRPGRRTCDACGESIKAYNLAKRLQCRTDRLCICCHKPNPRYPLTTCQDCWDRHKATVDAKKEIYDERRRRYRVENRERLRREEREKKAELRRRVLRVYGGRCACCSEGRYEFLTFDHVNNDGAVHRKREFGKNKNGCGQRILYLLIREGFPDYIQILCWNCNFAKHAYGICPHRATQPAGAGLSSSPAPENDFAKSG